MSDDTEFYESLAAEYEDEARRHEDHERAISEALQDREYEDQRRREAQR